MTRDEEQRRREREWTAEFERRAAATDAARAERTRVERAAALRAAWARGERGERHAFTEVGGPDGGEPVRIAVVWLGRFRAVARACRPSASGGGQITDGLGVVLLLPVLLLLGLDHGLRLLFLRLSGRPRWAVVAAVGAGGKPVVVHRGRDQRPAALAAAALAERVEREGAAALRTGGG
ncbi:hypothetical protein ABZW10_27165 [Kitasatospora sp. NPDC004723]|uniref:hypothetical protein n=1 Tax=Kitasatospora sp. NPDC004723 TaxID=3154288 RepID=UPI0033B9F28A